MWTLATETRKGIQNARKFCDDHRRQLHGGFTYARGYGFRVSRISVANTRLAFPWKPRRRAFGGRGFSANSTAGVVTSQNFFVNAPGANGVCITPFDPTGYTVNKTPDFVFKAAADPGYGHYELFGILSTFRNRIYPCAVISYSLNGTVKPPRTVTLPLSRVTQLLRGLTAGTPTCWRIHDSRTGGDSERYASPAVSKSWTSV